MKASMRSSTTLDVSVECVGMLERLMLAQAQECVFENTIAKGSTPGFCAKISRHLGEPLVTAHSETPSCNPHGDPPISGDCWYNFTLDDIAGEDKKHHLRKL